MNIEEQIKALVKIGEAGVDVLAESQLELLGTNNIDEMLKVLYARRQIKDDLKLVLWTIERLKKEL